MTITRRDFIQTTAAVAATAALGASAHAEDAARADGFYVGAFELDFTPPKPVALDGQMHTRISRSAATPITANILAFESVQGGQSADSGIIVSVDMVAIRREFIEPIRAEVQKLMPDFDVNRLSLSATHTHTAPVSQDDKYFVPEGTDYMKPSEFCAWAASALAPAILEAWNRRAPGKFTFGLGHAAVAACRRAVYADRHATMYGPTNTPNFRMMEAMEDHDVNTMFFWNADDELLGMVVNVSCPSQEVEGLSVLHADFWHPTRMLLKERFGQNVCIVALCGAAGDMSPHLQYRKAAELRMDKLRKISRLDEIARQIFNAVVESYEPVESTKTADVVFKCAFQDVELPMHVISKDEYDRTKAEADALERRLEKEPGLQRTFQWTSGVLRRYEKQQQMEKPMTLFAPVHAFRFNDAVLVTNPFELFTSFGTQMKARSKATQTFVVQLTDGGLVHGDASSAGYLPTALAYQGGGYSAIVKSVQVDHIGGQVLVEKTLEMIQGLF